MEITIISDSKKGRVAEGGGRRGEGEVGYLPNGRGGQIGFNF